MIHPSTILLSIATACCASGTLAQLSPVLLANPSSGFGYFEKVPDQRRLALVEPVGPSVVVHLSDGSGNQLSVTRQELKVINPEASSQTSLRCIAGSMARTETELKTGKRYLLLYTLPSNGVARLNNNHVVQMGTLDVAGQVAVETLGTRLSSGTTFEERYFGSLVEAFSHAPLDVCVDLVERLPLPPNVAQQSEDGRLVRRFTPYLTSLSDNVIADGGVFSALFHAKLTHWSVQGSTPRLLEALLRTINDARIDDALSVRDVTIDPADLDSEVLAEHKQRQILSAAQSARSDRAAALFAAAIHLPLRDQTRVAYLSLLKRDLPHLRAQICNDLAIRSGKRDRLLPRTKDRDGWEARVAAMAELWLREYGLGG